MFTADNRHNYCVLQLFNLNSQLNYSMILFIAVCYIEHIIYDDDNNINSNNTHAERERKTERV